jgi:hypothetical protein
MCCTTPKSISIQRRSSDKHALKGYIQGFLKALRPTDDWLLTSGFNWGVIPLNP